MNLTKLLIKSIKESTVSSLKVSSLKLEGKLDESSLEELFESEVSSFESDETVNWGEVLEALSEDTHYDEIYKKITKTLATNENISEAAVKKSTSLISKAIELAALNIVESQTKIYVDSETKMEENFLEAAKEWAEKKEAELEDKYGEVVKEWAEKKEAELKENLEIDAADIVTLKKAGKFVLEFNELLSNSGLSLDEDSKLEKKEAELEALKKENSKLKKDKGEKIKDDTVKKVTESLTKLDQEKFKSLAESIVFVTTEDYEEKLVEMKEIFVSTKEDNVTKEEAIKEAKLSERDKLGARLI